MAPFKRYQWIFMLLLAGILIASCGFEEQFSEAVVSQEELMAEAVQLFLAAQGNETDQFEIVVQEIEGGFARVQVISTDPANPGGFTGFLEEVEGGWTTLLVGSDLDPDEVQSLGIPQDILPDGWVFPTQEVDAGGQVECPAAGSGSLLLEVPAHGYCLLYPEQYTAVQPNPDETDLVVGNLMNHTDPRVSIKVETAGGRTAQDAADVMLEGLNPADFNFEVTTTTIGGEEWVMLANMPGQDLNRQLFVVREDLLYQLFFSPFDPSLGETYTKMEELYGTVTGSFTFQPADAEFSGRQITSLDELVAELAGTGLVVEVTGDEISQPFFTPAAKIVKLFGADLQIFEYESDEAAAAEAALVAPDGSSIGTNMVTWMASPHFFQSGRIIVLYLGDDAEVWSLLEAVLGEQVAGG